MKSKIQQKRNRGSKRHIKGGKPVTKDNIDNALVAAQNCMVELSTLMDNIANDQTITASQVQTVRLAAYELLAELNIMDSIIKKDVIPPVKMVKPISSITSTSAEAVSHRIDTSSIANDNEYGPNPHRMHIPEEYISSPEEVAITEEQVNQWIGRSSSMFDGDFGSLPIG